MSLRLDLMIQRDHGANMQNVSESKSKNKLHHTTSIKEVGQSTPKTEVD